MLKTRSKTRQTKKKKYRKFNNSKLSAKVKMGTFFFTYHPWRSGRISSCLRRYFHLILKVLLQGYVWGVKGCYGQCSQYEVSSWCIYNAVNKFKGWPDWLIVILWESMPVLLKKDFFLPIRITWEMNFQPASYLSFSYPHCSLRGTHRHTHLPWHYTHWACHGFSPPHQ